MFNQYFTNANIRGRPISKNNLRWHKANRIVFSSAQYVRFIRVDVVEVNFSVMNLIMELLISFENMKGLNVASEVILFSGNILYCSAETQGISALRIKFLLSLKSSWTTSKEKYQAELSILLLSMNLILISARPLLL